MVRRETMLRETTPTSFQPASLVSTFDTAGSAASDAFPAFCHSLYESFAGIAPRRSQGRFSARVTTIGMGGAYLSLMKASGHGAVRDENLVRRRPDGSIYLNYIDSGECHVDMRQQRIRQHTGRLVLLDAERPFDLDFTSGGFRLVSLRLPKPAIDWRQDMADHFNQERVLSPEAASLAAVMHGATLMMIAGRNEAAALLLPSVIALLGGLRSASLPTSEKARDKDLSFDLLADYIDANLDNPALSAAMLAATFGCTSRTIQTRFARRDMTVSSWIMERRLERARDMLADRANAFVAVSTIAYRCGFSDAGHFSRSFRRRFGVAPGHFRGLKTPG